MIESSDLRYAFRLLRKTPGFTLLTILVMAGGLAISIYTYALLNTMLYKDLPIPDGESVVRIQGVNEGFHLPIGAFELAELRDQAQSLDEFGVYADSPVLLTDGDSSRGINATYAEWNIFEFTRTRPLLGRGFVQADNIDGAEPVAVIGYKLWQSAFVGDPDVIDRVVRIDRRSTRIVGVMPPGYSFPVGASVWLPMTDRQIRPAGYIDVGLNAYARLRDGVSAKDAQTEVETLLHQIQERFPRDQPEDDYDSALVTSFQLAQTGNEGGLVFAVLNTVSLFILLLACVNVGNMLLARTNERIKEVAVRVALGAPRWRLMLQMMMESVLICLAGGGLAVILAGWALYASNRFLNSTFEGDLPFWWNWGLDPGTLMAAAIFVLLAVALVSALPTYTATCVQSNTLLRDGTRGSRGRTAGRISSVLVTLQIVLISVVMTVGSVMGIIALRAAHIDFGMDTTNLLTMRIDLPERDYATPEKQLRFYQRVLSDLRQDPSFAATMVSADLGETQFAVDDAEYLTADDYPRASLIVASETPVEIGTRLIEGRNFNLSDGADGLKSIIVSEAVAKAYWPDSSALGRRIRLVDESGKMTAQRVVVGVVSNVRRGENLLTTDSSTFASLYVPLPQSVLPSISLLVRHQGDEAAARTALYRAIERLDSYVVPGPIRSYSDMQQKLTLMATTMTDLFIRCGIFAVLLAMTGIYGLSSNGVVQRLHEIGLRRAVGATDRNIVTLFLGQGARTLMTGFVISGLISIAVLFIVAQFAGIGTPTLVAIGVSVALLVSLLVLSAIYVSTRRAVRHEPTVALRYE
jgi:predicted permease